MVTTTFLSLHFHAILTLVPNFFFSTAFSPYPGKRVLFLSLLLYQRRKLHRWQTEADVTIKIIIKNATSASKLKKNLLI